jgi:type III secretion protein SpaR/YscT/HrcT
MAAGGSSSVLWSWLPADIESWLWALGIGSMRTVPIAWLIPAFGGQNVPAQARMGIGLALAVLCLPQIVPTVPIDEGITYWIMLLAREACVGFTVGYVGSGIFRAAESAGRMIDTLRGANMAEVISPVTEGRSSPMGDIFLLLTTVIFLEIGGVGFVATALARSYQAVPLVNTTTPASFAAAGRLAIITSAQLMESILALSAPAIVALMLADFVLGAIARMASQIPVYFLGMPLKGLAGIGIVLIGMSALETALVAGFQDWVNLIERAFVIWR